MDPSPGAPVNPDPPIDNGPEANQVNQAGNGPSVPANADTGTSVYLKGMRSTVQVIVPLGGDRATMGSGSVVHLQQGYILTNWHVVDGSNGNVIIRFPLWANGRPVVEPDRYRNAKQGLLEGRVLASDQQCDLAVIKLLEPARIPRGTAAAHFAVSSPLAGAKIYSIGNPGASDSMWVYTPGDVRNVYTKKWSASDGGGKRSDHSARIIEATSPVSPGDSGGPCFNDRGEQIGVAQCILDAKVAQGYSTFIDSSEVKAFLSRNAVAYNVTTGNSNVQPPVSPTPSDSSQPSNSEPGISPNTNSTGMSESSAKSSDNSSPSRSSGGGSGRIVVIVMACLIAFGAIGAIIYGASRNASSSRRKRRRVRDI
jgi:hypothetical protein